MGGTAGDGSTSGLSHGGSSEFYYATDSDGGEVGGGQKVHLEGIVGFSGDVVLPEEVVEDVKRLENGGKATMTFV